MRFDRRKRSRLAVSEAIGAVLAIAITLIAGAATWSYVRAQAGSSEGAVQDSVVGTNNFLNEGFKAVDMYYPLTTETSFWIYNTGSVTLSIVSVRVFDSAGLVNLYYNYTQSGGVRTDQVYDLRSSLSTECKTAASNYETPSLTATPIRTSVTQTFALTIPPTQTNCPSFGQTFNSGTTYTIVVTGLYGNVVRYSQTA